MAGVVGKLCTDSLAVADGYAACSNDTITQARARILENFTKLTQSKQEFFTSSEEQEGHATMLLGESSSIFIELVRQGTRRCSYEHGPGNVHLARERASDGGEHTHHLATQLTRFWTRQFSMQQLQARGIRREWCAQSCTRSTMI